MKCDHYDRSCFIKTSCCDKIFGCRKCHDEYYESDSKCDKLKSENVNSIICKVCDTEQSISNMCENCNIIFGAYYCKICRLFDNDISKKQFHCEKCGICRVGGKENFYHCDNCNMCLALSTKETHICIPNSLQNCPLCFDDLFDSTKEITKLRCGHTIHVECLNEILKEGSFNSLKCPLCSKFIIDGKSIFHNMDREIEEIKMPDELNININVICNECNIKSESKFHIIGNKCHNCGSYNTKQI